MKVFLTPELENLVQAAIASGRYRTAEDVVNAALQLLQQQERIEPLHARVDGELAALTRGEGAEGEAYVETPEGELEESQEDERPVPR